MRSAAHRSTASTHLVQALAVQVNIAPSEAKDGAHKKLVLAQLVLHLNGLSMEMQAEVLRERQGRKEGSHTFT